MARKDRIVQRLSHGVGELMKANHVKIIKGEDVVISGKVKGNIVCSKRLELIFPAKVIGNIKAPIFNC